MIAYDWHGWSNHRAQINPHTRIHHISIHMPINLLHISYDYKIIFICICSSVGLQRVFRLILLLLSVQKLYLCTFHVCTHIASFSSSSSLCGHWPCQFQCNAINISAMEAKLLGMAPIPQFSILISQQQCQCWAFAAAFICRNVVMSINNQTAKH